MLHHYNLGRTIGLRVRLSTTFEEVENLMLEPGDGAFAPPFIF